MSRKHVLTLGRRIGLAAAVGLLAFGLCVPEALGQFGTRFSTSNPGFFPFYQVAPGLTLQQAALNVRTFGRAYSRFPPWAAGFAPNYALGYGTGFPQAAPGATQALMNSAALNGRLTRLHTRGYANPYLHNYRGSYLLSSPTVLSTSPYLYANIYAYANPYMSSNPYADYGDIYNSPDPYTYDYGSDTP